MSADLASEGKLTAATHAGWPENEKTTERRKENTAEPLKAKRTIAKPKTVADLAQAKRSIKSQKKWMMQLQQSGHNGIWDYCWVLEIGYFMPKHTQRVIFVDPMAI